jgi:hypothetical protein
MGNIYEFENGTPEKMREYLSGLDEGQLRAQEIMQQGAIHAISTLLKHGCTENTALEMLASLRNNASLMRNECEKRGLNPVFDQDQTPFN